MTEQAKVPAIRFAGFTDPWEQRKLGDVASSFDYGLNAAATEYDGQNKYLRITDIDDETHEFSKSDLTTPLADLAMSADYLLKESDLLFARTGASVGKTYLYRQFDGMVYFAGFLIRARIGEGADPEFAYQATLTDAYKKYVAITSQRSGQPGVNAQEYADYQLMLPSKTEQQQIGMTLRSLDDLITLHQRKYDKLVIFKKSMLEKMFPKDGESVPEIRFAGFTDPWEQRKLGDVADIKTGPFGTLLHAEDYVDDGIPIVTTEHFKTGALPKDKEGIPQVSEEDAKRLEQYRAKEGDILFSRVGSVDANAQVFAGQDGWLFSGRVLRARPDLTLVSSAYLHYELETEEVKSSVISRAVGGTMASINTEILFQTPIFIPAKMTEQNKIGSTCARLDSLITLHQRKLELLQNIKKSLLDKMFV